MSVLAGANHVTGNPVKDHSQGFDFVVMNIIRHNASLERALPPLWPGILDKPKRSLHCLFCWLFWSNANPSLDRQCCSQFATLIVVVKTSSDVRSVNIRHNGLIFILEPIVIKNKLSIGTFGSFLRTSTNRRAFSHDGNGTVISVTEKILSISCHRYCELF